MKTLDLVFEKPTELLEPSSNHRGAVPRDILLVINWQDGEIYAETKDPGDRFIAGTRWAGIEDAYILPSNVNAALLREWVEEEVVPRAQPLADAFGMVCDVNGNLKGAFPGMEEEKLEFDKWLACDAEPPTHGGGLWTVEEWLEGGVPEVAPDSSDEDLEILAEDLVREAESQDIVLVGGVQEAYNYLLSLRDSLREPDTFEITGYEVIEKIARATGTTAHVFVPVSWVGKKVKIIRVEP
jgi:putative transposon-encoded protein